VSDITKISMQASAKIVDEPQKRSSDLLAAN